MNQKSLKLFTTDVVGTMGQGKPEVIPANGQSDPRLNSYAATTLLQSLCKAVQAARTEAKVDRVTELVRQVAAQRSKAIPDAENAGPSVRELMEQQYQSTGAARARAFEDACRKAEAAYAARNPHKRAAREA